MLSGCAFRRRYRVMLCLLAPVLGSCIMLGQASAPPDGDLADASLEELMNVEVYSASKHLQSVREAPGFVTIVTADDIRNYGYRTLADILQSVPGFYVTYDHEYDNIGVRGFMRTSDYNTPFLLLIDGHRMNDAIFENSAVGRELPLDVDLIERVEVIRGPASSLYGANAFFGVINVITRRGRDVGEEISVEGASFGTGKGRVSYGHTFQRWEVLMSGSFYGSGGETLYFPEYDTPQTNNGIARGLDDESADDFMLKVSHGHFTFESVYGIRDKHIPTAVYGFDFGDPRERNTDERAYGDLSYDRSFGPWALAGRVFLDHYRFVGTVPGELDSVPVFNVTNLLGQWWGSELKLSRAVGEKHLLTGGLDVRDAFRQNQLNYNIDPYTSYLANYGSSSIWALYLQDEYSITSKLSLNLALRHDHYSTLMATNPRVAVIVHPWEHTSFKLVAGQAFRAPSAYELYFASPINDPSPSLHGETVRSGEVVVEQGLGSRFQLTACAYHNTMSGLIAGAVNPSDGAPMLANIDSVLARGLELELRGKLKNGIEGHASYTYGDADDRTNGDALLANSPRHLAKLNLAAPLLRRTLFAGWESQYTSKRMTLGGNYLGGFAIANLTLSARSLGKHADLSLSLYNLFDKKYSQPGGPVMLQDSLPQDGRSFRLKLGYRF
jgi:outer membrane receptor protein involved in Fe transport